MSIEKSKFRIEKGKLHGPNGSWIIDKISAIHKREAGELGIKKLLLSSLGLAIGVLVTDIFILAGILIVLLISGYAMHRTMTVYIIIDGTEIELHSEDYWETTRSQNRANSICDDLISLVANAQS